MEANGEKKNNTKFQHEVNERRTEDGKMRFLHTKGIDTYLKEIHNEIARRALMIRLNMVEWVGGNYGVRRSCNLCGEEDITEHVFACKEMRRLDIGDPVLNMPQDSEMTRDVAYREVDKKEDGDGKLGGTTVTVKDLENGEAMKEMVELFTRTEERRKQELLEDIVC